MSIEGVDYAFSRPDIPSLAAAGYRFASRYGGPGTADKWLTVDEARELAANGLWIVANAEGSAGGLLGGYTTGRLWAASADQHFRSCGMPADRPIYLSVDFDVTPSQWPAVVAALHGAADALGGVARVGVYGGRHVIEWARRDGVTAWLWQTYAWSGGVWVPGNHVEQYRNGVTVAGGDCDLNRALQHDYGQWQPGRSVQALEGPRMLLIKTATDPAVYVSDGFEYRHLTSVDAFNAAVAVGHQLVTVPTLADLEALAGKPAGSPVPAVTLSDADRAAIVDQIARTMPTPAQIAKAVNEDAAARLAT